MAVHIMDDLLPTACKRELMYENDNELAADGDVVTAELGEVHCNAGTIAYKAGFKNMKQYNGTDTWVEV